MKPPVIVVPGITATALVDQYPTDGETIWSLLRPRDYERTALHPDDLRYEQLEPAQVRPGEVFSIPYDELVKELRHDLTQNPREPRPVHLFPYDWRQPLERTVAQLATFIREVADRTALLRHYDRGDYRRNPRVDLVGHSMGGLLIAGYLAELADDPGRGVAVRKVVTLGTPFGGSFEAVVKVITGNAALGSGAPSSRERETARVTPALYYLLPRFDGSLLLGDGALPDSLFDPGIWQRSVVSSIASHIRLHGLRPPDDAERLRAEARDFLRAMLERAASFRDRVDALALEDAGLTRRDWLALVGVGEKTRVRLSIQGPPDDPYFDLRSLDRVQGYPARPGTEGVPPETDTGDGTVPWCAAVPTFLDPRDVVAVSPDDFGYWEVRDRILGRLAGLHSLMPAMNRCIKLTGTFLDGAAGRAASVHRGLTARRPPGVAPTEWDPPLAFAD